MFVNWSLVWVVKKASRDSGLSDEVEVSHEVPHGIRSNKTNVRNPLRSWSTRKHQEEPDHLWCILRWEFSNYTFSCEASRLTSVHPSVCQSVRLPESWSGTQRAADAVLTAVLLVNVKHRLWGEETETERAQGSSVIACGPRWAPSTDGGPKSANYLHRPQDIWRNVTRLTVKMCSRR